MTTERREDVVVVGGGAVGVCCAEALARSGRSVLLLERDVLCAGSSWGNSGLVTTSACAPEAAPGVMGQATRWLLDRDGPFRLRPRPDRHFVGWLRRFRSYCTAEAATRGTAVLRDLVRANLRLVQGQAAAAAHDFSFRTNGVLVLFASERGLADGIRAAEGLRALDIPSQALSREAVAQLEPRATAAVVGGVLYPEDADLDPGAYVQAVAGLARSHGARIEEGTAVVRLHGAHRVESVETASTLLRPELVVVANGAWAPRLLRGVGRPLPIEPGKGFSLTYAVGETVFDRPLRLHELRTIVTSMGANVRVTAKLDLVGMDTRVRERRIRAAAARAEGVVSLPAGIEGARAWAGLRPLAPDGVPLIGRSPDVDGLVLAVGHGHLGISLGAVTGEAVARIAAGEPPPFDPAPVDPGRFA